MKIFGKIMPPFITIRQALSIREYKRILKERKGYCNRCMKCCEGCIFVDMEKKKCMVYFIRPLMCRLYPNKGKDGLRAYKECTFYWDEK